MNNRRCIVIFLTVFLLLMGCNLPLAFTATPVAMITETPSPAVEDILTVTPTGEFTGQCAYMWANQELPEVSLELHQAFENAGISGVEARASAYGENCMDPASNTVARFSAMQTDFYLTITVPDTADTQAMGDWVERVLPVIDQFPPGQVPGPNPGYIGMRFTSDSDEQNLWFTRQKAQELISAGTTGSALFDTLQNP